MTAFKVDGVNEKWLTLRNIFVNTRSLYGHVLHLQKSTTGNDPDDQGSK